MWRNSLAESILQHAFFVLCWIVGFFTFFLPEFVVKIALQIAALMEIFFCHYFFLLN